MMGKITGLSLSWKSQDNIRKILMLVLNQLHILINILLYRERDLHSWTKRKINQIRQEMYKRKYSCTRSTH